MTKTELHNYRVLAAEVKQIQTRLRALESSLSSPNGQRFTRTPQGPNDGDRTMEALVQSHQELVSLYHAKLLELNTEMKKIEEAIESLEDPHERMLLRYRYLEGYDWPKVANTMHYSRTQTYRIYDSALQHLSGWVKMNPTGYDKDYSGLTE